MAIFKKTTKTSATAKPVKEKKEKVAKDVLAVNAGALVRPHVTEKAALLAEKNTYVFEVAKNTNKIEIARTIKAVYGVSPASVNIVNLPNTRVFVRGKKGTKSGVRKALVTLKKGDKIELI